MALWKRGKTWWADVTVNGQRYRESLHTTDRREAKNVEKELVAKIQAGKVGSPTGKAYARLPFNEAADIYVRERVDRVAERTIQFETQRFRNEVESEGGSSWESRDLGAWGEGRADSHAVLTRK